MKTRSASYKASLQDLRSNLSYFLDHATSGKIVELQEARKTIGFISRLGPEDVLIEDYKEANAARSLREIFEHLKGGKNISISRLSGHKLLVSASADWQQSLKP